MAELIVISSDDEPSKDIFKSLPDKQNARIDLAESKEAIYISSSSEDERTSISPTTEDCYKPCLKMNELEDLPNIRFKTREVRRIRNRHHNEEKDRSGHHSTREPSSNRETARIPPLPDPNLFIHGSDRSRNSSAERLPKSQTKRLKSIKKKRQSIEAIRSQQREILGDLFAVEKTKVVKRRIQLKDPQSNKLRTDRAKSLELPVVKDANSQSVPKSLTLKNSSEKMLSGENVTNKITNPSGKYGKEIGHSTRLRHSSDKTVYEKGNKKAGVDIDKDFNQCEILRTLTKGISSQDVSNNAVENVTNDTKRVAHVPVDDRKESDESDMCHHVNCSRTGPFDLLTTLGKSYREELENLEISPRYEHSVKSSKMPLVRIDVLKSSLLSLRKSISVESSESESDNEKGKRHFMDVFSDISEAESDSSSKQLVGEDLEEVGPNKDKFFGVNEDDGEVLDKTLTATNTTQVNNNVEDVSVIKNSTKYKVKNSPSIGNENIRPFSLIETFKASRNFGVKVDEFSDISDDEMQRDRKLMSEERAVSIIDTSDDCFNMNLGGNDILGNSTLSVSDTDSDIMIVDVDNDDSKINVENNMPVLEIAPHDKSKSLIHSFEMPILEKYTEMYSSFKDGFCEQEALPDIEDESNDINDGEIKAPELIQRNVNVPSGHSSGVNQISDNILNTFSLRNAISKETKVSETVSSFVPYSSQASTSSGIKHSNSDHTLFGPKSSSTPKRKHKIHKSKTFSSLRSCETYSSFTPYASSSHSETLALTKQMDQLTVYMNDFLRLSNTKQLPAKLPDAQKNIVYGCEEDGLLNLGHALNFIEHFCRKYIIPSDVCKDVIHSAFQSECSLTHIHWAYNILSELNMRRTAEIEISWEMMESCLNVALSVRQGNSYYQLLQSTLLLQLAADVLKMDLFSRNLSDNREIRKSYAYKMFAYDVSTGSRKRLIYFLNQALHAGQCRTLEEEGKFRFPDVLPILQDLLALCVDVSSSCIDCANILAADMVNTYKFLPNLTDKQLLIKSVSSQLLQCKLVQQVLESQYDCHQILGSAFPDSLEDIIQCFFRVMPLKNPLTPPTTPNEDIQREEDGDYTMFSPEVTEEIAILLYFIVVSYLQASNDKMYMALRLRVNLPEKKKRLRPDDEIELGKMHEHAQDLEHHLRCMNPNLTENTEHYLFLMRCLGDLGQTQQD